MVAAPVAAHDPRDEVGERALDKRRLVDDLEGRLRPLALAAGEAIGQPGLAFLEHADAVAGVLAQQRIHPRPPIDRDEDKRRLQRHRHEGVGGHAVNLLAHPGGDHGHAGREHAERPPELRRLHVVEERRLLEDRVADSRRRSRDREFAR